MISRKQFAHELIPAVLQFGLNEGGGEAVAAMLHKDFWEGMVEHAHPDGADFDWNEFAVEGIDYDDRLVAIVFEFPLPVQEEEARWGVIFIAKQGDGAQYFTLQRVVSDRWMVCTPEAEGSQCLHVFATCPSRAELLAFLAAQV